VIAPMRCRLRTLMILLALAPPVIGWMFERAMFIRDGFSRMQSGNGQVGRSVGSKSPQIVR